MSELNGFVRLFQVCLSYSSNLLVLLYAALASDILPGSILFMQLDATATIKMRLGAYSPRSRAESCWDAAGGTTCPVEGQSPSAASPKSFVSLVVRLADASRLLCNKGHNWFWEESVRFVSYLYFSTDFSIQNALRGLSPLISSLL